MKQPSTPREGVGDPAAGRLRALFASASLVFTRLPGWALSLPGLGGLVLFALHAGYYAHTQISVLDEGAYLLKGLFFVEGEYAPFQDYGPLTNHMPLSFLLHGAAQVLFGPGLRTGRLFSLALGILMLAGLGLLARRLRGPWWAALAVWIVAANPATARFYSLATTQAMAACLLVWTLVAAVPGPGDPRLPPWRTVLASVLAALLLLTRLNMAPVLLLLLGYILWSGGRRAGIQAFAAAALVLLAGHLLFWPGILKIWAGWLPSSLTPFLDPFRHPEAARYWDPLVTFANRLDSFLEAMRLHFAAVMGFGLAAFLWPAWSLKREQQEFKAIAFTAILFIVLLLEHMAASLGLSYCVYCFPVYLSFFTPVGVLLLVLVLPYSAAPLPRGGWKWAFLFVLLFAALLGFGAQDQIGDTLARLRLPRVRTWLSGAAAPGLPLWDVLQARFGLPYMVTRRLLPTLAGLLAGVGALWAGHTLGRTSRRPGVTALLALLVAGLLLTPSPALGGAFRTYDCGQDVLTGYETQGRELAYLLSPGETVYWRGGNSAVPLLYAPAVHVYPSQINGDYSLFDLADSDTLIKFGLWSEKLSEQWLQQAGAVLVEAAAFEGPLQASIEEAGLHKAGETTAPYTCRPGAAILVFRP